MRIINCTRHINVRQPDLTLYKLGVDVLAIPHYADGQVKAGSITFNVKKYVGETCTQLTEGDVKDLEIILYENADEDEWYSSNPNDTYTWKDKGALKPVKAFLYINGAEVDSITFTEVHDGEAGSDASVYEVKPFVYWSKDNETISPLTGAIRLHTDNVGNVYIYNASGAESPVDDGFTIRFGVFAGNEYISDIETLASAEGYGCEVEYDGDTYFDVIDIDRLKRTINGETKAVKIGNYRVPVASGYIATTGTYMRGESLADFAINIPFTVDIAMSWSEQQLTNDEFTSQFNAITGENGDIAQLNSKIEQTAETIRAEVGYTSDSVANKSVMEQMVDSITQMVYTKLGAAGIYIGTDKNGVPYLKLQGGQIIFADEQGNNCILLSGAGTFAFLKDDHETVAYNLGNKGLPDIIENSTSASMTRGSGMRVEAKGYPTYSLYYGYSSELVGDRSTTISFYRYTPASVADQSVSEVQEQYRDLYFDSDGLSGSPDYVPTGNKLNGYVWSGLNLYNFVDGVIVLLAKFEFVKFYDEDEVEHFTAYANGDTSKPYKDWLDLSQFINPSVAVVDGEEPDNP